MPLQGVGRWEEDGRVGKSRNGVVPRFLPFWESFLD
jgi:hypothetical protein